MSFHPSKSLRSAAAVLVVFALATIALALPRSAAAAPRCGGNSKIWVVNKKQVCLKTAKIKPGHAGSDASARIARWFTATVTPVKGSKLKIPKKLRASASKAAAQAAKLVANASWGKKKSRLAIAAASSGAVVETMSQDGPSVTLPSGVKLSSSVTGRAYEDGSQSYDVNVDATYKGYTVRYKPDMDAKFSVIPAVECPTADGLLKIDYTSTIGGTTMVLKGNNVLGAVTERTTDTITARGHVGRDAKLHDVDAKVSSKTEHYERGLQMVIKASGEFNTPREGNPSPTAPINADVNLRAASLTSAQDRAAEKILVEKIASEGGWMDNLASHAELGRWRMMQDEYKWYSLPGRCASVRYSPDSIAKLAAGKTASVEGRVESNAGGVASGEFSVVSVSRGSFTTTKAQSDPGAPAQFKAKGASPDADRITVESDVIATSTAGRAQGGWYAKDDLDLPEKISGTISSTSTTPGTYDFFHSWVVYTLDQVYVSDDGYISAWYKLTTADQDEVQQDIGSGCRWVGKGSGGNIEDGDIELRKPPGGEWSHAVMYDVEVPNTTFVPTDCGPNPPEAFEGTLVGFVNMAMLGGGFEPVGDGFHLDGLRSYKDPASQRSTVASWSLEPGDPQ